MCRRSFGPSMELTCVPLAGGRAAGPAHLVEEPGIGASEVPPGSVLVVARPWWPPPAVRPPKVAAVVLDEPPSGRDPDPSVPVVAGLASDLFREGERIEVDGDLGRVFSPELHGIEVVTVFLQRADGRLLLLRRSDKVGSFRGRWAGVSGFLEDPTPEQQAFREVREETGLEPADLSVERAGRPVYARDGTTVYVVRPFLFRTRRTDVRLDWEHTESEWVEPSEIDRRATVPKLDRAWRAVAPTSGRKG
jgi:ADP-ribose pyrophosphatase YjhB (NUDIX family)